MLVPIIILLATLENIWPIIAGYAATPKGAVFLGTIHHPGDYFYYLSQFAQGATSWLRTQDLYTSESIPPSFVGWINVLLGHLFHLVGIPPISSYHLSVILFTLVLFIAGYVLSLTILRSRTHATLALYLFAVFHTFPNSDYWNNYAVPSVRFGGVPHQLLIATMSILLIIWIIRRPKAIALLFIGGAILSSLQPVLWVLITATSAISAVTYGLIKRLNIKQLSIFCLPAFLTELGGILPALYLSHLFTTLPFLQLKLWESVQNSPYTIFQLILATGPILLIALLSIPTYLSSRSFARLFTVFLPLFSLFLFLSPLPAFLGLTQVRFMSTLTILAISIIAANGLSKLKPRILTAGILILLTLMLLPNHVKSLQLASKFDPNNAYQYLYDSDYRFLISASRVSRNDNDVFLVLWPYNLVFPGITGKRSFHGHELLTIFSGQKDTLAQRFFDGSMDEQEILSFMRGNHITYVVAYTWTTTLSQLPILIPVISTTNLVLYRVNK